MVVATAMQEVQCYASSAGFNHFVRQFFVDTGYFNKYLFVHPTTYKILAAGLPMYGISYILDNEWQQHFYCPEHHHNIHQPSQALYLTTEVCLGVTIPSMFLVSLLSHNERVRYMGQVFITTLPMRYIYKDLLKLIHFPGAVRPKNEHFSRDCTYYGGFPSGHMMGAVFLTGLVGAECGVGWALPFAALSTIIAVDSIAINRHTFSQVVGGTLLGAVFAAAAHHMIDRYMELEEQGRSNFYVSFSQGELRATYEFSY